MKNMIVGLFCVMLTASTLRAEVGDVIQTDSLAKTGLSWDGNRLPEYGKGRPEITILRIKIPPGMQLPRHKHPVINACVLLSGQLTVVTDEKKILHLKAGDSIVEVVDTWHYGRNEGNTMAEILVFYAGTAETPITLKK